MSEENVASILIVEDEPEISAIIHKYVDKNSPHEAFTTNSAESALELLKDRHFDVVITDIILPEMDGLALTDIIKRDFDADIIVMTGYSDNYSYESAINKGASDFVLKPIRVEELMLRLSRVLEERQLKKDRKEMLERLQELSITDGLTGLYNSRHFYNELKAEIERSNRYHHPLSLLLLDIDHFKIYNDSYGHLEGDKALVKIGRIIKSMLRTMDTAYRYGGEEFTAILPEASVEEAETAAQRIRQLVEDEMFLPKEKGKVAITISIGVTEYSPPENIPVFVKRADQAMYISKQQGRNRVTSLGA